MAVYRRSMPRLFRFCGIVLIVGAVAFYFLNKDNGGDIPSALGFGLLISLVVLLVGSLQRFEIKNSKLFYYNMFYYRHDLFFSGIKVEDIIRVELTQSSQQVLIYTASGFWSQGYPRLSSFFGKKFAALIQPSFNKEVLQRLFTDLKNANPRIEFNEEARAVLEGK